MSGRRFAAAKNEKSLTSIYINDKITKGDKMAYTKAGSKAVDKYVRENYDRFQLKMKKGIKETAKAHAESKGMSLNAYINNLIEKDMKDAN